MMNKVYLCVQVEVHCYTLKKNKKINKQNIPAIQRQAETAGSLKCF